LVDLSEFNVMDYSCCCFLAFYCLRMIGTEQALASELGIANDGLMEERRKYMRKPRCSSTPLLPHKKCVIIFY